MTSAAQYASKNDITIQFAEQPAVYDHPSGCVQSNQRFRVLYYVYMANSLFVRNVMATTREFVGTF